MAKSVPSEKQRSLTGRYSVLIEICLAMLACFTILRIAMLISFSESATPSAGEWVAVLWTGLRFDLLVTLSTAFPQLVFLSAIRNPRRMSRFLRICLEAQWIGGYMALLTVLVSEWMFFDEFRSRLNYIAFEYLVYPTEVCCNIWESYQTGKIITVVAITGAIAYALIRERHIQRLADTFSAQRRLSVVIAAFFAILGLASSTSMSSSQITGDRTANECASNGIYSFFYYAWTCRFHFDDFYQTTTTPNAIARCRDAVESTESDFVSGSNHPLDRIVVSSRAQRDLNVVLILEESLGSNFIGALGDDRGLSPEFDKLCDQGLLFDNWYATGNRTARALEAVTTSLPPLPTESILKRDHSKNVFTLANVLAGRGYERLFVTGGRGIFDGVRSFMTSNGFNNFVEQSDFSQPTFTNAWGVSDEDMFSRAIEELDKFHQERKPFFATLLTVSNHRPFTFPAGRISNGQQTREDAVRYADWALGNFFRQVRTKPYYHQTLFVVMGDHGARVYGSQIFPVHSYRVPVLVIDPSQKVSARCNTLASSLDIAPTILGLLGGEYRSVFFGRDALSLKPEEGYAIMQHNHELAVLNSQHHLTVLTSGKRLFHFQIHPETAELTPVTEQNSDDAINLMSLFQTANRLYYSDNCHPDLNVRIAGHPGTVN